ncbi:hypothetical protein F2P56_021070 [Juglans regia]|uniref:Zinc finger protein 236-like n=2 Tax=Juglans regia TaxID=51240 RepID=A0A2I4ERZ4_JUGRE|nr:zinc finger protein 236-like [Juglans regia]KAF5461258.1 hypothetical protein F2P56_021070 [Juglans regia]
MISYWRGTLKSAVQSSSTHDYVKLMDELNQGSRILGDDHHNMPCAAENADSSRSRILGNNIHTNGNGRLCIELKVAKAKLVDQQQKQEHPLPLVAKEFPHICNICDKGFGSGKALGGHMRMHVQARNKELLENIQNPKFKKHPTAADDLSTARRAKTNASVSFIGEPTCYVCGKKFPTTKALFGHMRSHPGRPWRGVVPPPPDKTKASSSSSTLSDDKIGSASASITSTDAIVVNLSGSLSAWKVTGKRGRKSITASTRCYGTSGLSQGLEEGMQEAIYDLMMLANSNPNKRLIDDSDPQVAFDNMDPPTNARNLTWRNEKLSSHDEHVPKKINDDKVNEKATLETAPSNAHWKLSREDGDWRPRDYFYRNGAAHEHEDQLHLYYSDNSELVSDDEISGKMMIRKVRKKIRKTMNHSHINKVPVTSNIRSYICSVCNKSFPTHQALGGHKSIHNKLMKYRQTMDESHLAANDSTTDDIYGHQVDDQTHVLAAGTYRCKICNKTFPTGQAFVGHKRCHVELQSSQLTEEAKAQSSQVTSPGEASQITGRKIFDFDLNDLPAMEVLEEGIDVESVLYVRI